MGLEDREYLRDEARRYGGGGGAGMGVSFSDQWAVRTIVIINIVVFVMQLASQDPRDPDSGLTRWLSLSAHDLASFQIWRLITYGFCHSTMSPFHLFWNMIFLWIVGRMVEGVYGSREFMFFYLTGIVISGLAHVLMTVTSGHTLNFVVGASGGVNAALIVAAFHFPRQIILVMMVLPVQIWLLAVIGVAMDVWGVLSPQSGDRIAHAAHLGGAVFGYFYYNGQWRISPLFAGLPKFSSPFANLKRKYRQRQTKKQLQVFEPNDDDLREQVDQILAKIKAQGEASLTDEERQTLERASRVFRGR